MTLAVAVLEKSTKTAVEKMHKKVNTKRGCQQNKFVGNFFKSRNIK